MSRVRYDQIAIPSIHSRLYSLELDDYSGGYNSFVSNDKFPVQNGGRNMWRLAQNARITTLGEYDTRKGFDFHSAAAGETEDQTITATTGAADKDFSTTARLAQKWTCGASGRLSKILVNIKNSASATGTIIVEHWTDNSGTPGTFVARSSIAAATPTSSYAYLTARFCDAPAVTATTVYWVIVYVQPTGTGSYKWSSTTSATTAMTSSDSGVTWAAASFAMNFKTDYCTTGGVKGLIRAYKADGTATTIFEHGTVLYSVNDTTGALTAVKTGLDASATRYRHQTVNDICYYVNGYDGLRKLTGAAFGTDAQVSSDDYTIITEHKGMLFLVTASDPNKIVFSNFADYETFTSTDFVYVPSPKTGDPITALQPLNGYMLIWTRGNKFILAGDDNATFSLGEAPDQKGTYTQETVCADKNYAYYLSDDGVYQSNGSEAKLLSENVYEEVKNIPNKDNCVLAINKGRLYLWYSSAGSAFNDKCYVWNLNYSAQSDTVESHDTRAYVGRAVTAMRDDDKLMVASSICGQAYWQENATNDHTNLGGDIDFALQTHYFTFDSPAVLHEVRNWVHRFRAQSGNYTVTAQYAYDLRDNWTTDIAVSVQGAGSTWGGGDKWGAFTWGTTAEVQTSRYVPGEYRRIAVRYKHYATRQPNTFLGHTLVAQARRIK